MKVLAIFILCVVLLSASALPVENSENSIEKEDDINKEDNEDYEAYEAFGDEYGDYEGDHDPASNPSSGQGFGLGDIMAFAGQLGQGILALLGEKARLIKEVVTDEQFQESLGNVIDLAIDAKKGVVQAAGPVVQKVASGAASVVSKLPESIGNGVREKGRLIDSIIAAANDTAPLIQDTLDEYQQQAPLVQGFARTYIGANIENARTVLDTFRRSLHCNQRCGQLEEGLQLESCRNQWCD